MSETSLRLNAYLLADRIDTRGLPRTETQTGVDPLVMRAGESGRAFIFRDGACVLAGLSAQAERNFLETLSERLRNPLPKPSSEEVTLIANENAEEAALPDGEFAVRDFDPRRLVVIADGLAKAASLNYYEELIQRAVERAEPLAAQLARTGRPGVPLNDLNRRMGEALTAQHQLVARMAVAEKPDILWDHPELERLYARIEAEYELRERAIAVDNRLDLLRSTTTVITDLIENERARRLEWIIIGLIAFEIFITLFTLASGQPH
ncbi:MAG: RMD1 family protein [Caulobacterales bacterium]